MKSNQVEIDPQSPESWPASLDALIAAPGHHTLLIENERVRVLQTLIPPGDIIAVHTHPWPSVIHTLSFSHFLRRDGKGAITQDTRTSQVPRPEFFWSPPLPPHSIENIGDADIRLILVEVKEQSR
jgi:quercetin dioxygenase-like cupin family protein